MQLRRWLAKRAPWVPPLLASYLCGAVGFLCASVVMVPGFKLKNLQQLGLYSGFSSAFPNHPAAHLPT